MKEEDQKGDKAGKKKESDCASCSALLYSILGVHNAEAKVL